MSEQNKIPGSVHITINGENNEYVVQASDNVTSEQLAKVAVALLKVVKVQGKHKEFNEAIMNLAKDCNCSHCKERKAMESKTQPIDPKLN